MPLISKDALYTDIDPNIPSELLGGSSPRRVLPEGDPDARYLLCGAGGTLSDELVARFNLESHDSISSVETADLHAELAATNRQTYADNAQAFGGAHKGLDTLPVSPQEELAKGE